MSEQCAGLIDRLIEVRKERGMSQQDVADAAGLTQSVVARLESKKAVPLLNTLIKVATALNCQISVVSV